MSTAAHSWRTTARTAHIVRTPASLCSRCRRRLYSKIIVQENDIVLLKKKGDGTATPILTKPLRSTGEIQTPRGSIDQCNLIGKGIRDVVSTNKKVDYRIHQPSLAEYITLSPRIVTPVYPADANLIVSLLDLHPSRTNDSQMNGPLEIFEAGTGHGALTLHLARAIHGANPPAPPLPPIQQPQQHSTGEFNPAETNCDRTDQDTLPLDELNTALEHKAFNEAYVAYLPTRRAVIHTLDISPVHSKHAQSVVRNFRQGIYHHNIDFHVGTIPEYLSSRLASTPESFLEHTILDLPNPHTYLEIVGQALRANGSLIIFCPSITQINVCVQSVREKKLPFLLETVLEVGAGAGVGGREWDVRAVKPRALLKAEAEAKKRRDENVEASTSEPTSDSDSVSSSNDNAGSGWEMVCRPKVGGRVSGGGFLGLWRRMEQYRQDVTPTATEVDELDTVS